MSYVLHRDGVVGFVTQDQVVPERRQAGSAHGERTERQTPIAYASMRAWVKSSTAQAREQDRVLGAS
ncbi:hypothetical protein BON30_06490 [Cystobacter ferrugineus]|uniref:Uncharacterized protein n=1 Tax=Cystobacter ferrugineus TaxID=83449 RepID=A0A1L9BKU3_9BACT|nr:hypothetical protein BON30_06490 [Cystobacter ferrugineus]